MSIFTSRAPAGKPRCARCKRPFTPRKEGDLYGPKCARRRASQQHLDELISPEELESPDEMCESDVIEVRDAKGEVTAVIV